MAGFITEEQLRQIEQALLGRVNLAPRSITEDKLAVGAASASVVRAGSISDIHVGTLTVDVLSGGTISGETIILDAGGTIKSANYVAGTSGWAINADGSAEFQDVTIRGAVVGGTIDIGTPPASFHVDINGNMWLGNAAYASAPFRVSSTGNLDIGGADATSWHVDNNGNMWAGTATFFGAPFRVSNDGQVFADAYGLDGGGAIWGFGGDTTVIATNSVGLIAGGFVSPTVQAVFDPGMYLYFNASSHVVRIHSPSTNASTNIQFYGNNVRQGYVGYPNTDDLRIWNEASSGLLDFGTQGTSRFWINSSGFVTVGNSSSPQNIQFRVYGARTDTNPVAFIWNTTSTPSNTVRVLDLYMNTGTANPGTDDDFIRFRRGDGTVVGEIRGTGAGGVTYAVSSDQRLKENITAEWGEAVQAFDLIPWKSFTWRTTGVRAHGVIAQEVAEVPEWQHVVNRGGMEVGEDPETGEPQEYDKHWAVDYVPFIGAIGAKLADVDARLKALEGR